MMNIQTALLYIINHNMQNPLLDQIVPIIYAFADVRVTLTLLALVLIASWKLKKDNVRKIVILCFIAFLVSAVFIGMSKHFYPSPRPFMVLEGIRLAVNDNGLYSFPSGHFSVTVTVLSIILMKAKKHRRKLIAPAISYLIVLTFVVMYGGVHYPIDVIGGGLLGLISALITVHYLDLVADYIISFLEHPRNSFKSFRNQVLMKMKEFFQKKTLQKKTVPVKR